MYTLAFFENVLPSLLIGDYSKSGEDFILLDSSPFQKVLMHRKAIRKLQTLSFFGKNSGKSTKCITPPEKKPIYHQGRQSRTGDICLPFHSGAIF